MSHHLIPHSDLRQKTQKYVHSLWQAEWSLQTSNKLFEIRPNLSDALPGTTSGRKAETVLCRLHTGHSHYTHSYLLRGEEPPHCIPCNKPISIKHVLLDCWDLYDVRRKYFTATSIRLLFRDVPPDKIFRFLHEVNLLSKL